MAEKILYHGTDVSVANSSEDIFGLVDEQYLEVSGNLTNDFAFAARWALRRSENVSDWARVLVFRCAIHEIRDLGRIGGFNVHGYATELRVPVEEVPSDYFLARRLRRDTFENLDPNRGIYFYRAPRGNVVEIRQV